MEIENILEEMRSIARQIDCLRDEIRKLRAECDGLKATDYSAPRVQGGTPTGIDDRVIKLEDRIERLKELIERRYTYVDTINEVLDSMPTMEYATIIRNHYLYNESWRDIEQVLNISREKLRTKLHKAALKEFKKVMPKLPTVPRQRDIILLVRMLDFPNSFHSLQSL